MKYPLRHPQIPFQKLLLQQYLRSGSATRNQAQQRLKQQLVDQACAHSSLNTIKTGREQ